MIQQYSEAQLKELSISELRDVCRQLSIPSRRSKADCVVDILAAQPQRVAQAELKVYVEEQSAEIAPEPKELTSVEVSFYNHKIYAGENLVAEIAHDEDLTQPWLVTVNGQEIYRDITWAKAWRYICWHHKDGSLPVYQQIEEPEPVNDYLFHDDPFPTPPQAPQVGDITMLGGYILRCAVIGGSHAIIWDIYENNRPVDRIYMGWDCKWRRSLSYTPHFASTQEAIADLAVAQAFINRGIAVAV